MPLETTLIFLATIAVGSYIQTVTGFAMGLIIMGFITSLGLAPVIFTAAVISVLALINTLLAVHQNHHHINWDILKITSFGLLPGIGLGIWLLDHLSQASTNLLQVILGSVIIIGGILLMLKPHPTKTLAPKTVSFFTGTASGIIGGLFSTGAPPMVYYLYKQPLSIDTIRSTLLSVFVLATIFRIIFISFDGHFTDDVLWMCAWGLPCVFVFTLLGKKFPPPMSDLTMRRSAFGLLIILGSSLLVTSI
ncbi:MAG: sulfite exporter TauE/SafE family protein [Methylococcales bacterium]|jgi:uncharacterized protein|nr:sulfite exporter TauE/SafE family protein [Methylococcales bacterium]MBT7442435.1 sulfite exporter TauE/SafE family protein [Methylococcales bacterium]